jgi:hypothetical protein
VLASVNTAEQHQHHQQQQQQEHQGSRSKLRTLTRRRPTHPPTHPPRSCGGTICKLGTKKHHDAFLDGIDSLALPGCFGMTELGHGSNVMGIETTVGEGRGFERGGSNGRGRPEKQARRTI